MDLSNDLISKFVKITSGNTEKESKEGTVYGTAVEYDGSMYVKIDGSDLLTPINTTANIKDGERVTIMIKDHNATVTGNITSPSASDADVQKVTRNVETITGDITEVETLLADAVYTKELDAEVARIDELIAGRATIEDLEATNAKIDNLEVTDLTAVNAEIENLKANKADITELNATNATIGTLDAEIADIQTLVNGNLTSDNILSFHITAQNTTMDNAFIKDAMVDRITANKIMSGTIDTNNVTIQSTDGSMLLQGTLIQMKDENGKVRIQIGKDNGGNFTFILYDANGTGVLIDEDGIQSSDAIADGLIVDAKVADNANISGGKLDIASVIANINEDGSTTIKSNKIYLDEQGQSLEVAFNSLKTQVETIQDVTVSGDLTTIVEQVQSNTTQINANQGNINTLIAENTSRKEEIQNLDGEIESVNETLSSKYSQMEQDIDGFKMTVADTYTTKTETTALTNRVTTAESKLTKNALTTTIGDYYTTSSDVETQITSKKYATTSEVTQTKDSLTATFTEMHNGGYNQGVTKIDSTGIKVTHSSRTGYTHISSSGFYICDGSEDIFWAEDGDLYAKGNITATSGKIANFTISGSDLIGSNVGMGGGVGANYAFWAGSNTSGSAPFRVSHDGSLTATKVDITGTVNATAGTFSGNIVTNNIVKAYNSVYAGAEIWGGYKLNSNGEYVSSQTFTIHGTSAVQVEGNPLRLASVTGEVKIGDASSYQSIRAREVYAQEIMYTDDIRSRTAAVIGISNINMVSANAFIEFTSGYGVIRVPDEAHLYLQTGGGAANTNSEVRCTAYKDVSIYVNLRAHNVCAQNAVYAAGVNVSSDRRRKRDIEKYQVDALNEVCSTPVYTYHLDVDKDEEMKRIGLIMQEAPVDAVDLTGQGIDLYQMCTMMWKAIQQLNDKIEG